MSPTFLTERVQVESPYRGKGRWPFNVIDRWMNVVYARRCLRDCLMRGEAPFASHLLYTQPLVLDDSIEEDRERGIQAGFLWGIQAQRWAIYGDRGVSTGMRIGAAYALANGIPLEWRSLDRPGEFRPLKSLAELRSMEVGVLAVMGELDYGWQKSKGAAEAAPPRVVGFAD